MTLEIVKIGINLGAESGEENVRPVDRIEAALSAGC